MNEDSGTPPDEPLGWGVVGNLTREATHLRADGSRAAVTRHSAPGAKLWTLPSQWGDGWEQIFVIGTRRRSRGRQLSRVIMASDLLVNLRAKPVFSPVLWEVMTKPWDGEVAPHVWPEDVRESFETSRKRAWVTQDCHLGIDGLLRPGPEMIHWEDQECDFCLGYLASEAGSAPSANPYLPEPGVARGESRRS